MTDLQRVTVRASEIRARLAELGGLATLEDEQRSELDLLRTEYSDVERRTVALTIAEDVPVVTEIRAEDREAADLERRASAGEIFDAVLNHTATAGATAELQAEHKMAGNMIPLALLRRHAIDELETRAVTPAPGNVGQNQSSIVPYVFPDSVAEFLGVDVPTVGVGEAVFPVLTKAPDVETPAENASTTETTGTFTADILSPGRLQASFFYSREDRARFAGMDSALRQALSEGLGDALDKQIVSGTNGLLTGTNLANNNVTAETTFALYLSSLGYSRVDGRYASDVSNVRSVVGAATYADMGGTYRANESDMNALDRLQAISGGVRVSAHVPAVGSSRQNTVVRLGMRRDMVCPIWDGVTLIPDEITKAGSGQIVITAIMLHAVKIIRAAGFYKQQVQHA